MPQLRAIEQTFGVLQRAVHPVKCEGRVFSGPGNCHAGIAKSGTGDNIFLAEMNSDKTVDWRPLTGRMGIKEWPTRTVMVGRKWETDGLGSQRYASLHQPPAAHVLPDFHVQRVHLEHAYFGRGERGAVLGG